MVSPSLPSPRLRRGLEKTCIFLAGERILGEKVEILHPEEERPVRLSAPDGRRRALPSQRLSSHHPRASARSGNNTSKCVPCSESRPDAPPRPEPNGLGSGQGTF